MRQVAGPRLNDAVVAWAGLGGVAELTLCTHAAIRLPHEQNDDDRLYAAQYVQRSFLRDSMGVPAPLRRKLRDKLGSDTSEGFVIWLDEMRAQHERSLATISAEGAEGRREMAELIHAAEARLGERIHSVEVRVGDVQSNLMKWSFVFWCGAVAAIAALAGVLRQ